MVRKLLQWHPAFHAALQIEFEEESDKLSFKNEHMLSSKPLQIDTLIIKVKPGERIEKNIGRIFRQYNIVEYKNPEDYVSINDYYKLIGYACIYQSDTARVCEIEPEELTLTFACSHFPRKLVSHLKRQGNAEIQKEGDGIYYVRGLMFPLQILIIDQLSKEDNFWLNCLRPGLDVEAEIRPAVRRSKGKEKQPLYAAVMDLIVRINKEKFEEECNMCDALNELFEEKMKERIEQVMEQGLEQGIRALILDNQEEGVDRQRIIEKLIKRFELTREQAEEYYNRFAEE